MSKRRKGIAVFQRTCCMCGKRLRIKLYPDRSYRGGEFFGRHKLPIAGTGKWVDAGTSKLFGKTIKLCKWTGKEREVEHWECPECYGEAVCEYWLEQKIEKLYGKKCKDYEPHCPVCEAWRVYDCIYEDDKKELEKKQRAYWRMNK